MKAIKFMTKLNRYHDAEWHKMAKLLIMYAKELNMEVRAQMKALLPDNERLENDYGNDRRDA